MTLNEAFAAVRNDKSLGDLKKWVPQLLASPHVLQMVELALVPPPKKATDKISSILAPMSAAFEAGRRFERATQEKKS